MGAGVFGLPGRSAAGPVEEECPPQSDTVTAPGVFLKCIALNVRDSTGWIRLVTSSSILSFLYIYLSNYN